jgi:F-type H+-transporting ATPase subunit a
MAVNATEYIQHHLKYWQWSPVGDTTNFWTLNLDTIFVSIVCGLLFFFTFLHCVKKAKVDSPSKFQVAIESIIGFVDNQVVMVFSHKDRGISAFALSVFMWIWLMNFMDLIPVDLIPFIASKLSLEYFRAVPTADLSLTMGLSLSVFFLILFESIRSHGFGGFLKDVVSHPFSIYCFPANILFRIIGTTSINPAIRSMRRNSIGAPMLFLRMLLIAGLIDVVPMIGVGVSMYFTILSPFTTSLIQQLPMLTG